MKLTDMAIKRAKPKEKSYTLADGNGLSLLVETNGSKGWRYRYQFAGKTKMIAMLQREAIEAVMMELAHQQGQSLNGRDRLAIRTGVAQTIQAKERHRRRMTAPTYQWTKPAPKR